MARRYGEDGKMVAYIAPDFCIGKNFHGIKSTVYEDDNYYQGLPYIAEGTHLHLKYTIYKRYCRLESIEIIE